MICQGWRRLEKCRSRFRRPYYQLLVRQLAQEQDFVVGRGCRRPLSPPSGGDVCRRNFGGVSV